MAISMIRLMLTASAVSDFRLLKGEFIYMMLPNQINNQRFTLAGKGGYKAIEVDAFIQRVYQNYNKLYNENNILKERLSAITPLIDEYNENKRAIADALIWAKTTPDKTVEQAQHDAEKIIDAAKIDGDKIIADKTAEAQAVYSQELNSTKIALENAKAELEMIQTQAKSFSERYISEINSKAESIIEDANANASKIVADAYKDAQTAREKADSIISKANEELLEIKNEASKLKKSIETAVKTAAESVADFSLDEIEAETVAEPEKIVAKQIDINEIEEFNFDFDTDINTVKDDFSKSDNADEFSSLEVETVIEDIDDEIRSDNTPFEDDFISGAASTAVMPDVSAYISKIFESAGNEESDFSSFAAGLDDAFAQSLEDFDVSFDDLKKAMESGNDE